jgi:hypothetical protein
MSNFAGIKFDVYLNMFSGEDNPVIDLSPMTWIKILPQLSSLKEEAQEVMSGTGYAGFTFQRTNGPDNGGIPAQIHVFKGSITFKSAKGERKRFRDGFGLEAILIQAAKDQGHIDDDTPTGNEPATPHGMRYLNSLMGIVNKAIKDKSFAGKLIANIFSGKLNESPTLPSNDAPIPTNRGLEIEADDSDLRPTLPEMPIGGFPEMPKPIIENPNDPNAGDTPDDLDDVINSPSDDVPAEDATTGSSSSTKNNTYKGHSPGAKPYNPRLWNDDLVNRCYNYSNNKKTDPTARPGRGGNKELPPKYNSTVAGSGYSQTDLINAMLADGILQNDKKTPCPPKTWKVAWMYKLKSTSNSKSGIDYHFVRMDKNGIWSHKPGQLDVINTDDNGNLITDPKLSFELGGFKGYNRFGGFLTVGDDISTIK